METLIKSTLQSEVSGGRVKYIRKPNIWCGDPENGYLPGDLVDANGLADFIAQNDIIHDDPAIQELREAIDAQGGSSTTYIDGKVEQLQEDDAQIRQLINQTNANFENYYTKQQTYSASEIDTMMNAQRRGQFVIANVLPQASEDTMFKIYLVPSIGPESNNIKDEFVTLQNDNVYSWEQIGSTAVDLSGYSTTAEMNTAIASAIAGKQDKIDSSHKLNADLLQDGSTNKVYTSTEKTKLSGIQNGAQVNVKPDWEAQSSSADGILNKPDVYTKTEVDDKFVEVVIDANGHDYVDLGLPSGTLWATMNVGATSETGYGLYFQWGDTQGYTASQVGSGAGKKAFRWADYKWTGDGGYTFTKYNVTDGKTVLDLEDDSVAANWGGSWKMPTAEQFQELLNTANCTNAWTTVNGVNGRLFTSVSNGNTLFIPAAGSAFNDNKYDRGDSGYVWSSSLYNSGVQTGRYLSSSNYYLSVDYNRRFYGQSVRGVLVSAKTEKYATKAEVEAKQDTISDLATIRSGAAAGATAVQTETDPTVPSWAKQSTKPTYTAQEVGALPADTPLFDGDYNSLTNKPTIPVVPTNVSEFTNDAGYLTQHQDISGKQDKITSSNKLSADLLQDGTTNKVYTSTEKTKLNDIESGAQVNVKPDWDAQSSSPSGILNKPEVYTKSEVDNKFLVESVNNNGHTYVDLGLPSGTLWATMNVGANSETDYGNYYMYGKGATQYNSSDTPYSGTEDPLDSSVDTAVQVWGGGWHMPTRAQMEELKANTTYQWVEDYQGSGINGGTFTATNGAVLFIPAAGHWNDGSQFYVGGSASCWGSSPGGSNSAYGLNFSIAYESVGSSSRKFGYSVRPVIEPTQTEKYATKVEVNTKQDALVSGTSIKTLNGESILGSGNIDIAGGDVSTLIETTYAELVAAKNGGTLAKGAWYRITDYVTTTAKSNTQSANHAFDVIVRADSESVLNENAFAIQHEGDTYFANQKLSAWELKYDINNNTTKYAWADVNNGKGVIYYMKDENDNECPYDFKNIQFKVGAKEQAGTVADVFYFTFSVATGTNDATVTDHSLNGGYCYGNKMGLYISSNKRQLNANVFRNTSATSGCNSNAFGNGCHSNALGNNCSGNTFGNTCYSNTFGDYCNTNTFENGCYTNTLGNNCSGNAFGNTCHGNTFGNNCSGNAFGNACYTNTFGNNCMNHTFGISCYSNAFGDGCNTNTLGNNCNTNAFGDGCNNNAFGNGCNKNAFGNSCYYNAFGDGCNSDTFGSNCGYSTFGNNCSNNKFGTVSAAKDYYQYIIFENGVQYVLLDCTQTTSGSAKCQNVIVGMGIKGTSSSKKTLTVATAGNAFKTVFKTANDVEVTA